MRNRKYVLWMTAVLLLLGAGGVAYSQTTRPAADAPSVGDAPPEKPEGDQPPPPAGDGQDAGTQPAGNGDKGKGGLFGSWEFMLVLGGAFVLMLWFSGRSRKKKESKRREMLAGLKKGDKVTSIGGIVGTVIEVREDEVTVKVDETNNVRMKFARWAIRGIGDEAKTQAPEEKK